MSWPDDHEEFEKLAAEIRAAHPDERRVAAARLHVLDDDDRKQRLPEVVAAADAVIAAIDRSALAEHFGRNIDSDDSDEKRLRRQFEKDRDMLTDALYRKGRALGYMELPEVVAERPIDDPEAHDRAFEENYRELARWVDATESDYSLLAVRRDRRKERWGLALQGLAEHVDGSSGNRAHHKKRRDMYGEMGWDDWRDYEQKWMLIRFPEEYQPF